MILWFLIVSCLVFISYRVSDVYRSITKTAVKDMRTSEIKRELLLSETLQTYFAEHPEDMKVSTRYLDYLLGLC